MKASQRDFASIAARAARAARIFYFCGPDEAGAAEAARQLVALLPDPGERVELAGGELKRDPARLGDEARSTSLFGGSRHIYARVAGDEAVEAVSFLLDSPVECCPVLILASGATDKSRTAKLLVERGDALVAMFWPPELRDIADAIRRQGEALGLRMEGAIPERIARGAGLDIRLAQSELAKLALYLDATKERPRRLDAEVLDAIGAPCEEDGFAPLVNAVLAGDTGRLAGELARMREMALNPVGVLLAFERRAAQLGTLAAKLGPGRDIAAVIEAEKAARRIFGRDDRELRRQLAIWRGPRLPRLVGRLAALHRALFADSHSAELLLAQGLGEICRRAAASTQRTGRTA